MRGFAKGDRIAIMLPNTLQYPIALFGALRAGLVVVNTNPLYTATELEHQLSDSGATAIRGARELRARGAAGTAADQGAARAGYRCRRYLRFPKSAIVNYVVRHVRKQVPALEYSARRSTSSPRSERGPSCRWRPSRSIRRISPSCSTRAAPRASPRARCSRTAMSVPTSCRPQAWLGKEFEEPGGV